jgi:CcmD family protein
MRTIITRVAFVVAALLAATPAWAQNAAEQAGGQVRETIPAAPYLAGAYAFIWVAVLVYVVSVSRRLRRVQSELDELRTRMSRDARA